VLVILLLVFLMKFVIGRSIMQLQMKKLLGVMGMFMVMAL